MTSRLDGNMWRQLLVSSAGADVKGCDVGHVLGAAEEGPDSMGSCFGCNGDEMVSETDDDESYLDGIDEANIVR